MVSATKEISPGGMPCKLCASGHREEFAAEMIIHFAGLKNVDKPGV